MTREELLRELERENRESSLSGVFFFQAVAERSGMNPTDLLGVALLSSRGPMTAGGLAEAMRLTTGAVTGVVNRLERSGYVRRTPDPADGRRVIVTPDLEALGQAGVGFFGPAEDEMMGTILAPYSDRDLAVLLNFMKRANAVTEEGLARLRAASAGGEQAVSAPLGAVTHGRLVFPSGASRLTLRAAPGMSELYRAEFGGTPPKVEVEGGTVTVRRSRRFTLFDMRKQTETFTLSTAVPWEVEVRGGAAHIDADLSGASLGAFTLRGGIADAVLKLPPPTGTVTVRLSGGMSSATIDLPAEAEVRLSARGGVGTLTFRDLFVGGVGGRMLQQSPGFGLAADRYDIELSGGAGTITVR